MLPSIGRYVQLDYANYQNGLVHRELFVFVLLKDPDGNKLFFNQLFGVILGF